MKRLIATLILALPMAANADLVEIDFEFDFLGDPIASAGQMTLGLNGDGTISATVESFFGTVIGIGIDAGFGSNVAAEYDFSPGTPSNLFGWSTSQGLLLLGFYCSPTCVQSDTWSWTIGSIGQFTSVFDILGGSDSPFDAFLYYSTASGSSVQTFGNAESVSVPEPGTLALLGIGLVGMAATRRRRKA